MCCLTASVKITTDIDSLRSEIRDKSVRVIDVRREGDYKQDHIPNSVNLPLATLLSDDSPERVLKLVNSMGIDDETPVVGGAYLALCIIDPPGQIVNAMKVKGFLDTVKGEGASRGIFITTGYFSDEAIRSIDEEPVELVDVVSFVSYLKRFGIYETPP